MFSGMGELQAHCEADTDETVLLNGPQKPIVLLRRKPASDIAPGVYGTSLYLGAFLPYTPMQHLLLETVLPAGNDQCQS